jgi:small neutral amino acid transporter SnatA (MarC family)
VSTLVLLASEPLSQLLGKRGLHALQRLMGMLLTAVAVQMFLTGVEQFLGRL